MAKLTQTGTLLKQGDSIDWHHGLFSKQGNKTARHQEKGLFGYNAPYVGGDSPHFVLTFIISLNMNLVNERIRGTGSEDDCHNQQGNVIQVK